MLICVCCSLCAVFDELPEPDEEEDDMLDLALGVTDTYVVALF